MLDKEKIFEIIRELNDGWTIVGEIGDSYAEFVHPQGYGIVCYRAMHNKLEIGGRWPKDADGYVHSPYHERHQICVSSDRPAKQIAKEITRRLLSKFVPKWLEMKARAIAGSENARKADEATASLASIIGSGAVGRSVRFYGDNTPEWADFNVWPTSVSIKASVNHETALKIARLMKSGVVRGEQPKDAALLAVMAKMRGPTDD